MSLSLCFYVSLSLCISVSPLYLSPLSLPSISLSLPSLYLSISPLSLSLYLSQNNLTLPKICLSAWRPTRLPLSLPPPPPPFKVPAACCSWGWGFGVAQFFSDISISPSVDWLIDWLNFIYFQFCLHWTCSQLYILYFNWKKKGEVCINKIASSYPPRFLF